MGHLQTYLPQTDLVTLNQQVISCTRCPRLRAYCHEIAQKKKREFQDWNYWGKPVPGYGDPTAQLLIIGLAPAAHGANRTGRMFTGDGSAQFLMRALHCTGFANQPTSLHRDDGLKLTNVYLTAVVRCAPPKNKPTREEIENCLLYLMRESDLLRSVRAVLVLGRIAFDGYLQALKQKGVNVPRLQFRHGERYELSTLVGSIDPPLPTLFVSYHPSRQNTQTGRLTEAMFNRVFLKIQRELDTKRALHRRFI